MSSFRGCFASRSKLVGTSQAGSSVSSLAVSVSSLHRFCDVQPPTRNCRWCNERWADCFGLFVSWLFRVTFGRFLADLKGCFRGKTGRGCLPMFGCVRGRLALVGPAFAGTRGRAVGSLRAVGCRSVVTWLILPEVICLSQRLSHACASINA